MKCGKIGRFFGFFAAFLLAFFVSPSATLALSEPTSYVGTSSGAGAINLTPSKIEQYKSFDYVIDKYNVDMVVNQDNTFEITETITAYFNKPKHGIIRSIPLTNTVSRLDGTTSKNRAQVTNVSVNEQYTSLRENGNLKLKIGDSERTLIGEQTYVIKYTYNIGKDPSADYDEFYYNIIGDEWDTVIGNVTFSVTMPREFDTDELGFAVGATGTLDNSKVIYNVSGNKITGNYDGILGVGEALTVRCELPEGYFVGAGLGMDYMSILVFILPLIFLAIAIFVWYKYGRDDKVVETVEFYPPKGLNSLEVGFLYNGCAENRDVTSLLIYLANRGYIKIAEAEKKNSFSKSRDFLITKLKEYDGNNLNERAFLDGMFAGGAQVLNSGASEFAVGAKAVSSEDLRNKFYVTMDKILDNINSKENKEKLFEKSGAGKSILIGLMIIVTYCLITIPPILAYSEAALLIVALLFPGIGFAVVFRLLLGGRRLSIGIILFALIWGGIFAVVPWVYIVLPTLLQEPICLYGYIFGIVCIFGMVACQKNLPKRTVYGNEILGKLRGFRNYLETAEKDKLEAMVMENPTYFYDILPFAYVLGVSDKWIKNFESIALQAPSWYDSSSAFNMAEFGTFVDGVMTSAENIMSSNPSSGSGSLGGSSGGGSSGGGSGGGGGSSW